MRRHSHSHSHCHAHQLSSVCFKLSTGCWLLLLLLLVAHCACAKETSEFVKGKICIGTNGRMSVPSNREHHYRNLQNRYTNCTYVDGNLELTWLQDENLDLSFLQYIREVTGYVLISHVDVRRITLPRLQIIRGRTLFKLNIHEKEFALIVTLSKMHNLEMPALRDILTGSVGMFNNYNLCHMKTIKWDEIITGPGAEYVATRTAPMAAGARVQRTARSSARSTAVRSATRGAASGLIRANAVTSSVPVAAPDPSRAIVWPAVTSDGPCPKTCEGVDGGLIHSGNINDFKDCTIIEGSISILDQSFKGFQQVYNNYSFGERYQKMHPDSLEVFSTLKEVTGYINIQGDHPDFTNLSYFRNLEVIGGRQLTEYFSSLYIVKTSLKSLGLRALKKVHSGSVAILENKNLCFAQGIDWNRIKKSHEHTTMLQNNKHDDQCKKEGLVCDVQCSLEGCWGPGPDQCLACKNYQLGTTCLEDCDAVAGMYKAGGNMCMPCHEECESTCHGPGPDKCTRCKHVKDGPFCVQTCPDSKYNASGECRPCHANCIGGCDGPHNTIGPSGCKSCEKAFINDNITVEHCLQKNESCPDGYYHEWVGPQEQGRLQPLAGKGVCRKCHPRCRRCTNYGFHIQVCQECAQYKRGEQCEDECPSDHFAHELTQECKPCSVECRGCFGPDNSQCLNCRNYKIYVSGGDGDPTRHDNTTRFNCTATCPPEFPHKIFPEDNGEPYCSVEPQGLAFLPRDAENIPTIVAVVVACALVLLLFLVALLYQWRQRAKAKENAVKMTMVLQGLDEPLSPTNVKPNLAKLRIIKEHELRKGGVLGYGAFGTVYKGVWVPEGENIKIPVAIKVLRECTGAETTKEFLEEAYIMVTVVHPNLLQLLAVCLTSKMMLVTQLMPLGCLLDYVRNNKDKIGSKPLLNWCTQIARGMAYLEEKRLVHRDLAARNVLVQTPNCVKVTDFGLAKLLDINEDQYKAAGGKMPIKWLALECIQHRIFTHKSDVWAFGVTVWELLTYGGRPYESVPARDVPELLETGERLPQPNICTIDVYMLMINCWMLDAESRPSFKELADQFAKMARDPGRYLVIPGDKFMRLPSYSSQEDKEMITMDASDGMASAPVEGGVGMGGMGVGGDTHPHPHTHTHPHHAKNSLYPSVVLLESPGPQNQANWDREMMRPAMVAAAAAAAADGHSNPLRYCVDPLTRDCMEFAGSTSKREAQVLGDLKLDLPLDEDDYLMPSPQQSQPPTTYMDLIGESNMQGELAANVAASRMANGGQEFLPSVDNPEYHMVAASVGLPHVNGLPMDTSGLPVSGLPEAANPTPQPHKSSEEESDHEYYNDYDRLKRELQPLRRNETTV
ncbi:epidermal growth factor receptor [Nilaparvata lugens]|uniref:epidermal growth factor receptor n=1 Tax=Nilaparvata lugens TaxID=108931 RepID=UPI00193D8BB4|nr:epidermal growth factor receptor [Nilaparvata lugens]